MEQQHYHYYVSMLNDEHTTIMPGDIFKFYIKVSFHSINTNTQSSPYYSPSQSIPCHNFFLQDGQDFLGTLLSPIHLSIESLDEITEGIICIVQELFQVDVAISPPPPYLESQHQEIPLWVKIILYDNNVQAAIENSMQNFRMIPAANEVIYTSLKKSRVMTQSECCSICLEELVNNTECYAMPCNHTILEGELRIYPSGQATRLGQH
ncbi:hypothetical protein CR513_54156, partial [Mucuna pruriens]